MSLKENSKYHKIFQVLQHICSTWEKYTNLKKKQKTNKQTIINIKGGTIEKVGLFEVVC